ncbi:MAG: GlxA family transcriptional regulator [Gammaproteobacteria bacterium]
MHTKPGLPARRERRRPHRIVMLAYPQAQVLDITGPLEVFARTSRWLRDHRGARGKAYEIELVAARAGPIDTSGGLQLVAARSYRNASRADTLLIAGGIGYEAAMQDEAMLTWIREQSRRVGRIGSICTGAMVLAAAGLLDGKRATTHWAYCTKLARLAPAAHVEEDALYVRSGKLYTSAGVTAGMDMALAMVEEDWGKATALAVAQELVMFLKRPGGQSQFSRYLEAQQRDDRFGRLELWMLEHLDADLSVERLASRANLSPRHFAREFAAHVGATPAAYVMRVRVEEARRRIEDGATQLKDVARQCGFGDAQRLRRAFRWTLGVTPQDYRARFAP